MKILFLDIDGVLCTDRSHRAYGVEGGKMLEWDPLGCAVIKKCCERGVRIVVSSTWRHERHQADLFKRMELFGLREFLHSDWRTIDIAEAGEWNDANCRGLEVRDWLDKHPEVTSYRILDDVPQFLPDQASDFIQTDAADGMTSRNILLLMRWARALKS